MAARTGSRSADGLDGRDVFALAESPDGTILAGTNHGIFALDEDAPDPPDERCDAEPRRHVGARATRLRTRW